ncbi:prephenate dehydratase [Orenia metallireducens]|uniref:prephenate dehydratase n=1 Tax=Orenia metallireducens TaxID=1413210 RepID=UPI000D055BC1|nr:prephenate dehydratase domain-containing protein [Orenia metallireducens]PRX29340.1 prephenate dehydratase [Orenia metallireducens]
MNQIATLGAMGTFSEIATKKYIEVSNKKLEISYYPTIRQVFKAIGQECNLGIVPIENTLDGFVQRTLDLLLESDFYIVNEIIIPIQFSFVANSQNISDIEKIYVQFKTRGQCYNFLDEFNQIKLITTESNSESFSQVKKGHIAEGAIIPRHLLDTKKDFSLCIDNVADSEHNQTRFIVLAKPKVAYKIDKTYKTSIIILEGVADQAGVLSKILNEFSSRDINLKSIISRPTKQELGKYYFFIDIEGHKYEEEIREALDKIRKNNLVKILGSYSLLGD